MKIDLHMHSTGSDGVLTPPLLVEKAISMGVTALAITDHDTFAGVDTLRGKACGAEILPGVELSLRDRRNMHLLGYGLGQATSLHRKVEELAARRVERALKMVALLRQAGMPLDADALLADCGGTIGRPHIARAMVAAGYAAHVREAFDRYLGEGRRCYVAGERLSLAEALPLMRESGFVPVLAHPRLMGLGDQTLMALLPGWQAQGLMGLEVYHPSAEAKGYAALDRMARRQGLLVTGGSDFHQEGDGHGLPGCTAAAWHHAVEDFAALKAAMENQS